MTIAKTVIDQTRNDVAVMRRRVEILRQGQSPGVPTLNGEPPSREEHDKELAKAEKQLAEIEEILRELESNETN